MRASHPPPTRYNVIQVEGEEGIEEDVDHDHDDGASEGHAAGGFPDVAGVEAHLSRVQVHRLPTAAPQGSEPTISAACAVTQPGAKAATPLYNSKL